MPFTIPDSAAANPQSELHSADLATLVNALAGTGVVSGCAVSAQGTPDMTVAVTAGTIKVGSTQYAVAGGNSAALTADGSNPRYVLIEVTTAGAITLNAGTAAPNPVKPTPTAGRVVLAEVFLTAAQASVVAGSIVDKRVVLDTATCAPVALDAVIAPDYQPYDPPATFPPLYKGIAVPTGIATVSLRFDDGRSTDNTVVAPELASRDLVAGFALCSTLLDIANHLTTAEALALQDVGHETMCHSATHGADPANAAAFIAETLTAQTALKAAGLHANAFVQPGTWVAGYYFRNKSDIDGPAGMYLQRHFSALHSYLLGAQIESSFVTPQPAPHRWGSDHATIETSTLAALKQEVDFAVATSGTISFISHSNLIGSGGGNISLADFQAFLDYLVTKRDAGLIEILTPTGLLYCEPGGFRTNLLADPGFEDWTIYAGATKPWTVTGAPSTQTGRTGGNALRVTAATDTAKQVIKTFPGFTQVRVSAWVRTSDGALRSPKIILQSYDSAGSSVVFTKTRTFTNGAAADGSWSKVIQHFGVRPDSQKFTIELQVASGNVDFDDVEVCRI